MPMLTDEVQEFLRCAERLVLAECDLRTDASGISKAFLPKDAETIFSQADFLAAQIAPSRYTFGLVVRLIGEPDTINAISEQYQIQANNQAMQAVSLLDATDVRLVPVELWNHWPDEAKPKYLQLELGHLLGRFGSFRHRAFSGTPFPTRSPWPSIPWTVLQQTSPMR